MQTIQFFTSNFAILCWKWLNRLRNLFYVYEHDGQGTFCVFDNIRHTNRNECVQILKQKYNLLKNTPPPPTNVKDMVKALIYTICID